MGLLVAGGMLPPEPQAFPLIQRVIQLGKRVGQFAPAM